MITRKIISKIMSFCIIIIFILLIKLEFFYLYASETISKKKISLICEIWQHFFHRSNADRY